MDATPASGHLGLAFLGDIARLLNSSTDAEEALTALTARVLDFFDARAVRLWLREPNGTFFWAISAPLTPERQEAPGLDRIPPPAPGVQRIRLAHAGEALGILEVDVADAPVGSEELIGVLGNMLAPYLAALELSADLASEVAVRTREIERHRQVTALIIDSLPVGLYVVDREYRIQIWNRKRETGTQGLLRDDVVGLPVFEVLTRQPAHQLKAEFDEVFQAGEMRQMEMEVTVDGEPRFYRISKIPMALQGQEITHVITIGEDVTEWHGVQHRIMQSEKLAAIGQLAAGIMHEINNPLATIGACGAAIEGRLVEVPGAVAASLREYVDIIDKEVQRCTGIVDGLLDFSRPKDSMKKRAEVSSLIDETLFLLKHHRRFKKVTVRREYTSGLAVIANAEQLIQVFMALMLNAADAMEQSGRLGTLTVRTALWRTQPERITIAFEDTGVGIPHADLNKIFEPFYSTKTTGRGTGLGLSICYGIIEEHRGVLAVESQLGHGSTFRVTLPSAGPAV
jgi:two-component system NtrC family sensor kinase